jgi:hypothetical protein
MADLAIVFHWAPPAMNDMSLADLMDWREQARRRNQPAGKT